MGGMHPVIKLVSFLVFGISVTLHHGESLLLGLALLAVIYLLSPSDWFQPALRMLLRMRWFFVSIALVYLLSWPGRLIFPGVTWGPTYEGVQEGALRIVSLSLIVLAVNLLLRATEREALIGAILWCLQPLRGLGLSHDRLAIRIALTLDAVHQVQGIYRKRERGSVPEGQTDGLLARVTSIGATAGRLFQRVLELAEQAPLHAISLPPQAAPALWQWLLPLVLGSAFALLSW